MIRDLHRSLQNGNHILLNFTLYVILYFLESLVPHIGVELLNLLIGYRILVAHEVDDDIQWYFISNSFSIIPLFNLLIHFSVIPELLEGQFVEVNERPKILRNRLHQYFLVDVEYYYVFALRCVYISLEAQIRIKAEQYVVLSKESAVTKSVHVAHTS